MAKQLSMLTNSVHKFHDNRTSCKMTRRRCYYNTSWCELLNLTLILFLFLFLGLNFVECSANTKNGNSDISTGENRNPPKEVNDETDRETNSAIFEGHDLENDATYPEGHLQQYDVPMQNRPNLEQRTDDDNTKIDLRMMPDERGVKAGHESRTPFSRPINNASSSTSVSSPSSQSLSKHKSNKNKNNNDNNNNDLSGVKLESPSEDVHFSAVEKTSATASSSGLPTAPASRSFSFSSQNSLRWRPSQLLDSPSSPVKTRWARKFQVTQFSRDFTPNTSSTHSRNKLKPLKARQGRDGDSREYSDSHDRPGNGAFQEQPRSSTEEEEFTSYVMGSEQSNSIKYRDEYGEVDLEGARNTPFKAFREGVSDALKKKTNVVEKSANIDENKDDNFDDINTFVSNVPRVTENYRNHGQDLNSLAAKGIDTKPQKDRVFDVGTARQAMGENNGDFENMNMNTLASNPTDVNQDTENQIDLENRLRGAKLRENYNRMKSAKERKVGTMEKGDRRREDRGRRERRRMKVKKEEEEWNVDLNARSILTGASEEALLGAGDRAFNLDPRRSILPPTEHVQPRKSRPAMTLKGRELWTKEEGSIYSGEIEIQDTEGKERTNYERMTDDDEEKLRRKIADFENGRNSELPDKDAVEKRKSEREIVRKDDSRRGSSEETSENFDVAEDFHEQNGPNGGKEDQSGHAEVSEEIQGEDTEYNDRLRRKEEKQEKDEDKEEKGQEIREKNERGSFESQSERWNYEDEDEDELNRAQTGNNGPLRFDMQGDGENVEMDVTDNGLSPREVQAKHPVQFTSEREKGGHKGGKVRGDLFLKGYDTGKSNSLNERLSFKNRKEFEKFEIRTGEKIGNIGDLLENTGGDDDRRVIIGQDQSSGQEEREVGKSAAFLPHQKALNAEGGIYDSKTVNDLQSNSMFTNFFGDGENDLAMDIHFGRGKNEMRGDHEREIVPGIKTHVFSSVKPGRLEPVKEDMDKEITNHVDGGTNYQYFDEPNNEKVDENTESSKPTRSQLTSVGDDQTYRIDTKNRRVSSEKEEESGDEIFSTNKISLSDNRPPREGDLEIPRLENHELARDQRLGSMHELKKRKGFNENGDRFRYKEKEDKFMEEEEEEEEEKREELPFGKTDKLKENEETNEYPSQGGEDNLALRASYFQESHRIHPRMRSTDQKDATDSAMYKGANVPVHQPRIDDKTEKEHHLCLDNNHDGCGRRRTKRSADADESSGSGSGTGSKTKSKSKAASPTSVKLKSSLSPSVMVVLQDNNTGPNAPLIKIGVLLPRHPLPWQYQKCRAALEIAAEKVRAPDGPLPGYRVQIVYRDSGCSQVYGVLEAIDLYVKNMAHVFIGPGCDYPTASIARYSYYWGDGIPVLTAAAMVGAFTNKKGEYRLLTRVQGSYPKMAEFFTTMMDSYGWNKMALAFHDHQYDGATGHSDCFFSVEPIFLDLRNRGTEAFHIVFNEDDLDAIKINSLLNQLKKNSRIVVMCAKPDAVREIMIRAHELNFDNGEYVFFYIDLFHTYKEIATSWKKEGDTDERNEKARKAYEALMIVVLRMPTSEEYKQFSVDVKARAADMFPNFTYGEEEVNSFVGAFHDAVLLYALALNETLAQNGSITNGEAITKRMWNRTFVGITGNVSIDDNGDRNADYSLLDLNPETQEFEVVANYFGNTREYEPVEGKSIHWAGGRTEAPEDTPKCGFDGSKCPPEEPFPEYAIVIIVLGSILLIVLIAVFFIYRHIKLEAELAEMNWRVRWDDILFGAMEKNRKLERSGSRVSLAKASSIPSECSGDTIAVHLNDAGNRQLFTRTGYYKGAIIAIKPIHRTSIAINKPMLLEIKRIKDLQNDHIVRFLGACIDYPNLCVLTEYCPKGSLQDVLENDQIKLDWMFRYSIMQDIVRGMAYLQGTEVRSHGYLKSTNCVVDSRFVVKITDFGLHHLKGQSSSSEEDEDSYSFYHKKLWTAPELLRMSIRPPEGTLKGDVYSFGIICQEIVYRNGVFYLQNLDVSPKEIHQKVKNGLKPFFRPTLEEYDCPCDELAEVIRRCWSDEPAERPDFQALKSIIRKLNHDGDKGNILDNLLTRMEQYANNLEALVEERTADYLQQKKKAEDLLYNMLPKKVASQLIRGECVTAEWYDSVSIYFSDICGFTAMSAESTPMQVVDLLNDLYTAFDSIIENFDVYKVETIGDAYMVVSGLPDRNGTLHAREIARMSLSLLKATMSFRVRHRPNHQLKLRIGIHTGSVCAGVVGLKMPRYCLFGDTVNTASRMESNGLPLRIHVSPVCKEVLDTFNAFELELRGNVEMKGKGLVKTYWLLGEKNASDSPGVSLNIL